MILISDDLHDYVAKKGGGRALRLERRRRSQASLEKPTIDRDGLEVPAELLAETVEESLSPEPAEAWRTTPNRSQRRLLKP